MQHELPLDLDPQFNAWWELYPRKVGKIAARKAFTKARHRVSYEHLLSRTATFAKAVALWPKEDARFVPHPTTWLNQGRWDDDTAVWFERAKKDHSTANDVVARRTDAMLQKQRAEDARILAERRTGSLNWRHQPIKEHPCLTHSSPCTSSTSAGTRSGRT